MLTAAQQANKNAQWYSIEPDVRSSMNSNPGSENEKEKEKGKGKKKVPSKKPKAARKSAMADEKN